VSKAGKLGVVLLNFGEPAEPTMETVVPYLERIFGLNVGLAAELTPEQLAARNHEMAVRRAPGLIEEYQAIGGSPLAAQAREQAEALQRELAHRGHDVSTYVAMQFTEPSIRAAAEQARADGVERLVGFPIYPMCGTSTTVAALRDLAGALEAMDWHPAYVEISGWHGHPDYAALRAVGVRDLLLAHDLELNAPGTKLVFSAHGIPMRYIHAGNRYDLYTYHGCQQIADALGTTDYLVGFQNHTNRPIEWTQPDIESVIAEVDADTVVVVPVSFMHEQSETLSELDIELRQEAEERGLTYYRVPVPHDDARFTAFMADLVEARLSAPERAGLGACRCRPTEATCCTNSRLEYADLGLEAPQPG
jgi:ferrochelatase